MRSVSETGGMEALAVAAALLEARAAPGVGAPDWLPKSGHRSFAMNTVRSPLSASGRTLRGKAASCLEVRQATPKLVL